MVSRWLQMAAGGMGVDHPPALRGVWAKMARAHEHYELLQQELESYLKGRPWSESETREGEIRIIRAQVVEAPPIRLGVILGDTLHNLRSALDHLVYAFQPAGVPERESQFPILDAEPVGGLRAYRYTRHLPSGFLEMLHDVQPYQSADTFLGRFGRELRLLRELSNRDKHRVLLLAGGVVLPGHVTHNAPPGASAVEFRVAPDWRTAEIRLPTDGAWGPYYYEFDAEVHIDEPGVEFGTPMISVAVEVMRIAEQVIGGSRAFWTDFGQAHDAQV